LVLGGFFVKNLQNPITKNQERRTKNEEPTTSMKSSLRRQFLKLRDSIPAKQRKRAADDLILVFEQEIMTAPDDIIGAYYPMGSEVDVLPLLRYLHSHEEQLALPVIQTPNSPLIFKRWTPDAPMAKSAHCPAMEPQGTEIVIPTILLVPLLAFDGMGNRLGFGSGYYDRTLAALRAQGACQMIGVAYPEQEVELLPVEPTDEPLDGVLVVE
jgi:5-formyltetrahydrofolate cyclo-ligase